MNVFNRANTGSGEIVKILCHQKEGYLSKYDVWKQTCDSLTGRKVIDGLFNVLQKLLYKGNKKDIVIDEKYLFHDSQG